MIVDHAGGYVSTDRELQVKLLQENVKDKGLIFSKDEVPKRRIVVGLKRTCVVGSCTLGEMLQEKTKFENPNSQSPKGEIDLVHWFGGPHVT
jgi:hypothetical protein